jgi:prolipoprotein diacylglyceryltransferase
VRPHLVHWLDGIVPGGIAAVLAPTWFTCVGLAGVVALFAMLAIARRHRLDRGAVASIVLWCYVAAVAAGIAIPSAIDAVDQLLAGGHAQIRWAGMTSFWGYLAGGCAVAVACHAHGVPLRRFADLAVAPMGVALMLARIGCFVAGCDYGKVSSLPWAVRFPAHSPAWQDHVAAGLLRADRAESLPVHPTELYEAALGLAIAVLALGLARRRPTRDGRVFLAAAALYAIGRIAIEDLRGDAGRGIYLGLSSGQIFSLLLLATIVATIAATTRLRRLRPVAATSAVAVALTLALAAPHAHAEPAPTAAPTAPAVGASKQPFGPQLPPAQPAPQPAQPQPFGPQLPPAQPAPPGPQPAQAQPPPPPLYTPSAPPAAPPGQSSFGAAPAGAESAGGASLSIGALVGAAAPFNRRRDQVATLAGGSASIGFGYRALGAWLDLDSFANRDARHGTLLVSGGAVFRVARHLEIGGRVGVGATLVNFDDPAFRDVVGTTGRFEAMVDVRLGESWLLWIRPLALDVLSAADLGGPIATWQARLGLAYQFQFGRRTPAPALYPTPPGPPPDPAPAAAPPRAP